MKIDGMLMTPDLGTIGPRARRMEEIGYDGLYTAETKHDPFFPLVLAAEHTERIDLATAIAVAFPRSPMHLAHVGHDIQRVLEGPVHPRPRFPDQGPHREAVQRLLRPAGGPHAGADPGHPGHLGDVGATTSRSRFEGEFYRHTLMTPFFNPGPTGYGPPRIFLAAVGEKMTEVAGEVCDGMFVHGFTTEKYLRETTIPAIERGLAKSGRSRADIELSFPTFIVTGETDEEWQKADASVREQIAFYGSTPAYRPVLEAHGWGEMQDELNRLSKQGAWKEMGKVITDDILDAFAVRGAAAELPGLVLARYGDLVDRLSFYAPYRTDPETWADVVAGFKAS